MDATKSGDACKNNKADNGMEGGQKQQDDRNITASTAEETHNNKDVRNCRD